MFIRRRAHIYSQEIKPLLTRSLCRHQSTVADLSTGRVKFREGNIVIGVYSDSKLWLPVSILIRQMIGWRADGWTV